MRQQVLVIHGGTTFDSYEKYLEYLKNEEIYLDRLKQKGWKENLQESLGNDFDVILAKMPNKNNAKYIEWAIYFNNLVPLLDDDLILVGHSLGGIFLAKYLSENLLPKKIKALILIAAPFDNVNQEESLDSFNLLADLGNINRQCENIFLIHSKDDNIVEYKQSIKYEKELTNSTLITFENKRHFGQETFPEIKELIIKLKNKDIEIKY